MTARLAALAVVACLATGACSSGSDDTSGVTTTSNPARPSSTTTTAAVPTTSGPTDATDEEILAGVAAGSVEGAALLPDVRWTAGVRRGCADLGGVPDDQVDDFFELFRIQVEDEGGTRAQSLSAVQALVGGFLAACPELGERLAPLVPAS